MPFTSNALNSAVNGIATAGVHISAHTADPGTTGANQHGTRVATTWAAPSNGARAGSEVGLAIAAGTTITHWGLWSAATGGTFLGGWPLAAAEEFANGGTLNHTPTLKVDPA